jgi:anti-sigma B factor antagonist
VSSYLPVRPSRARPSPVPGPLFAIEVTEGDGCSVIRIKGELDLAQRPRLDHALAGLEAGKPDQLLIDLDGLTFIDAAGLYCLEAASTRSAAGGSETRMTRGRGDVARMLHLTSLDQTLPFIRAR